MSDCSVLGSTGHNLTGIDPSLGRLGDNGGTTATHAPLPGSPAIDAANPAGCTDELGVVLLVDQRGLPRTVDGDQDGSMVCDIGALEVAFQLYLPLAWRAVGID